MKTLNEMNQTHTPLMEESDEVIARVKQQLVECDEMLAFCGINLDEEA